MVDDPRIEKVAEATSPDGHVSSIVALWSDGTISECVRTEGKAELTCESFEFSAKTKEDLSKLFRFTTFSKQEAGWKVRVLHDPGVLDFLPSLD